MFARHPVAHWRLLFDSVAHARRAPFYARRYPQKTVTTRAAFERLPLLEKTTAAAEQEQLIVPGVRRPEAIAHAGVVSSATTREGRPLRILRSPDDGGPAPRPPQKRPERTIRMASPRHGLQWPHRDNQVLLPATWHVNTVDVLLDLLAETQDPVRGLVAPVSHLKFITASLSRRGLRPAHRLRGMGTTGYPLTEHARAWMSAFWKVPLYDNYSLSELPGYAYLCPRCGHHHWDGAPVHFELIDPVTLRPTRARWGELVATTLIPGVRLMPLVRYRTGDLVHKGPACGPARRAGMRFLGRRTDSVLSKQKGRAHLVVGGRALLEWGEAQPDVAQVPHPAERLGRLPAGSGIGVPKARADHEGVVAELRFLPAVFPRRAETLRRSLARLVRRPAPAGFAVHVVGPGTLDLDQWAMKL